MPLGTTSVFMLIFQILGETRFKYKVMCHKIDVNVFLTRKELKAMETYENQKNCYQLFVSVQQQC